MAVPKAEGASLGAEVSSALFDQVRTCDNHCEFCFIHQLPQGLRPSLYVKDDDYRLSFLYGNYTTLTRFTELDLERVVTERLSPINVSIHATDPEVRARMLRNRRGATSLRWLRALLDAGIEVHGQVVVCPGVNDGAVLDDTLAGVLDEYPELATACVVPLGVSRYSKEGSMRPHSPEEAAAVVDLVEDWQSVFLATLGRRVAFAADEYYLLAGRPFPPADAYEGFPMHEDGVGMARVFELELTGLSADGIGVQPGFFAWVDGAPADGYRAPRLPDQTAQLHVGGGQRANCSEDAAPGPDQTAQVHVGGGQRADCSADIAAAPDQTAQLHVGGGQRADCSGELAPAPDQTAQLHVRGGERANCSGSGDVASGPDQTAQVHVGGGQRANCSADAAPAPDQTAQLHVGGGQRADCSADIAAAPDQTARLHVGGGQRADWSHGTAVITGEYGARVLGPLLAGYDGVRVVAVENRFFGGNIGVTGLLVGEDVARVLAGQPEGDRYLLPDVCLSNGVFLDGTRPADLPRPVEVVVTDGVSLRRALARRPALPMVTA